MFCFHPQEVYSRDEGNSPDDHENDLFEKVTRQICNRIDELEDDMKRNGSLADTNRSGGGGGDGGGGGGGGGGCAGDGGLSSMVDQQTGQLGEVKRDINELKSLIMQMLKMPLSTNNTASSQVPQDTSKNLRSSMTNLDPMYPQLPPDGAYPTQPSYPKPPPPQAYPQPPPPQVNYPQPPPPQVNYPPQTNPYSPAPIGFAPPYNNRPPQGYLTDTEVDRNGGGGRRRRRGKRNGGSGYDSDSNSFYSEQVPMQNMQRPQQQQQQRARRPRSPSSVASAPTGNKKNRRKKNKNIGGSWEDIRADINI